MLPIVSQTMSSRIAVIWGEDGASGRMTHWVRPTGRRLCDVILPGAGDYLADREAIMLGLFQEKMVHPGGFEPPTARFVAEYSIQLSYGCIRGNFFTTLSSLVLAIISQTMKQQYCCYLEEDGASGRMTHWVRPTGRRLCDVILPGTGDYLADHETTE